MKTCNEKIYTNESLKDIPNVNGLQWSMAGKGDWMIKFSDVELDPLA